MEVAQRVGAAQGEIVSYQKLIPHLLQADGFLGFALGHEQGHQLAKHGYARLTGPPRNLGNQRTHGVGKRVGAQRFAVESSASVSSSSRHT
jgi:hypothetical protein